MLVINVIVDLILMGIAAHLFASELETVSATRALKDADNPKRYLELGISGRIVLVAVPVVLFAIILLIKRWFIPTSIIVLIVALLSEVAFVWLRLNGFKTFKVWLMFYFALTWTGMNRDAFDISKMTTWTIAWSVIMSITVLFTIIAAIILIGHDPDAEEEDDEEDAGISPIWGKIFKIVIMIVAVVVVFSLAYWLCNSLIVPRLS